MFITVLCWSFSEINYTLGSFNCASLSGATPGQKYGVDTHGESAEQVY